MMRLVICMHEHHRGD